MQMPSLDKDWNEEDYTSFFKLLREIKGQDKYSLPRYGSVESGEIFDKLMHPDYLNLVNPENLNTEDIFTFLEKMATHAEALMDLYLEPRKTQGFGIETLISLEGMIRFIRVQYDLFDQIEADYPNATSIREALIVEQIELLKAFLDMLSNEVIYPAEQKNYLSDRGRILCSLSSNIPNTKKQEIFDQIETKANVSDFKNLYNPWLNCFNPDG
jgi:hypothetical protein